MPPRLYLGAELDSDVTIWIETRRTALSRCKTFRLLRNLIPVDLT
jgi:hypothetical protein